MSHWTYIGFGALAIGVVLLAIHVYNTTTSK